MNERRALAWRHPRQRLSLGRSNRSIGDLSVNWTARPTRRQIGADCGAQPDAIVAASIMIRTMVSFPGSRLVNRDIVKLVQLLFVCCQICFVGNKRLIVGRLVCFVLPSVRINGISYKTCRPPTANNGCQQDERQYRVNLFGALRAGHRRGLAL